MILTASPGPRGMRVSREIVLGALAWCAVEVDIVIGKLSSY